MGGTNFTNLHSCDVKSNLTSELKTSTNAPSPAPDPRLKFMAGKSVTRRKLAWSLVPGGEQCPGKRSPVPRKERRVFVQNSFVKRCVTHVGV